MNYSRFAIDHKDECREAYGDIDMGKVGQLLDEGDYLELGKLIWLRIDAAKESVEDDLPQEKGDIEAYKEYRDLNS